MTAATGDHRLGKRKAPPPKPLPPDWKWIKRRYRTGATAREIARESTEKGRKISHVRICAVAKEQGWEKDLAPDIRAKVGAELAADAVSALNRDGATDDEIVEAAAKQGADVIRTHRRDINALRGLTVTMAQELAAGSQNVADLAEVIERGTAPAEGDDAAKVESLKARRERLMRLIGLQSRAGVLKDLTQSTRHLIGLERQAWNLNDQSATPDSVEERLARLEEDD